MVALDPDQEEPEAPLLDLEIGNATDCKGETKKTSGLDPDRVMVALDPDPTPCGGEAPLLDLEIGTPEDATAWECKGQTKKKSGLAAAFARLFEQTDAEKEEADRVARWAIRVFLLALWLYLVNLMRQFVIASGTGEGRACTAAAMFLVAFSLGGLFCVVGTPEDEHTDGEVPKPAPRPRPSSREDGWTQNPNLLFNYSLRS